MKAMDLPANASCPIARSLGVLGQKWTLLIVREAMLGRTRYAEFLQIGIPTDILVARLNRLVEEGVFERRPYRTPGERAREEYVLTDAGRDLLPVLAAFAAWGERHRPAGRGPKPVFVDEAAGTPLVLAFAAGDGRPVDQAAVHLEKQGTDIRVPGA